MPQAQRNLEKVDNISLTVYTITKIPSLIPYFNLYPAAARRIATNDATVPILVFVPCALIAIDKDDQIQQLKKS